MMNLPFAKYTSYGNNFVIVDETMSTMLTEAGKSRFGHQATNTCFGVGSDNLLFIQRCDASTLAAINDQRGYWDHLPDASHADYIFRMFEPDGQEALCCGNGLMCIADYLFERYGVTSSRIMTEVPRARPEIVSLGRDQAGGTSWVDLGHPARMPEELVDRRVLGSRLANLDEIRSLSIEFRSHDLASFSEELSIELDGYLVFTGEPHLVVFCETPAMLRGPIGSMFLMTQTQQGCAERFEKRVQFGSWLLHRIGSYLNSKRRDLFPAGINVNFARVLDDGHTLEYRCYERGINRETLACGTGALAVAYAAAELRKVDRSSLPVLPHRCRWHMPDASLNLCNANDGGWVLSGVPVRLFTGDYDLPDAGDDAGAASGRPLNVHQLHNPPMPSGAYIAVDDDAVQEASLNR